MEQKEIEQSFNRGKYQLVLDELNTRPESAWKDTTVLRCLRSMGKAKLALELANRLHKNMLEGGSPYQTTRSERNHQRRYIALVFAERGQAEDACKIMQGLCLETKGVAALHREYAFALTSAGELDLAEQEFRTALRLKPSSASLHAQLARLLCRSGRAQEGYDGYVRAASIEPENVNHLQQLVYWSNYLDNTTQQSNYQLARLWAGKAFPERNDNIKKWSTRPVQQGKIKLGFVSADLCAHSVSFFIKPLLNGLNRDYFDVIAYSDTRKADAVTAQIHKRCDVWRDTSPLSDSELSTQIDSDEIDILLDLNGHTPGNRLNVFAAQAAPLQMTWLGYPATTGLQSISHRITDRIADPVGLHDEFYSEKLLRISNGFLCYEPLATAPEIDHQPSEHGVRFCSFNNLAKVSSTTLDCWAATLKAVPESTLYIKRHQLTNEGARQRLLNRLSARGIDIDRITLGTSKTTIEEHMAEYNHVDIALDTSPYNGMTTTFEALWMGVPVISFEGNTHASRVSSSILHRLRLSQLAATSVREFAIQAAELAGNESKLNELRNTLRARMTASSLMDAKRFGRNFGDALRHEWQAWENQRDSDKQLSKASAGVVK